VIAIDPGVGFSFFSRIQFVSGHFVMLPELN
jgi:hypothetical protein